MHFDHHILLYSNDFHMIHVSERVPYNDSLSLYFSGSQLRSIDSGTLKWLKLCLASTNNVQELIN